MPSRRIILGLLLALVLVGLYGTLSKAGLLSLFGDHVALREPVAQLGFWGPLAIVVLMTAAIVMSPIPSGPIALAAGAAYGPLWGTLWVVLGAEAGALIAFAIARYLGYEAVRRRSQTMLMAVVVASRLVPFISFDAVSYAAGLTPLAFWRFAIATLVGVIPVAFLFAYFGEELVSADSQRGLTIAVLIGGITLVPIALRWLWTRYR